ncbi:MAG: hypothetical protein IVW56_04315 [Candidatus Binataceae bacterium]|nr:hypothetical protein [Candidatus Binataceae bacterium]
MATKTREEIDRNSAADARRVIEVILPDESERRAVLSLLADLIERANRASVKAWGLTLKRQAFRLNVGPIEEFTLFGPHPGLVRILVDGRSVSVAEVERLKSFDAETHGPPFHKSVPASMLVAIPSVNLERAAGSLLPAALSLVDAAVARRRGRLSWSYAHSPGAVQYLGEFLGRDLPQPSYDAPPEPAASVQIEEVPILEEIPIEELNVDSATVAGALEPHDAEFRERAMVIRYAAYLRERSVRAVRYRIKLADGTGDLFCDLWDARRRNLIEAKGEVTRDSIRMAIGQLADYGRFLEPDRSAVLLPERPPRDLEDLLRHVKIGVVWEPPTGGFEDNSSGRFI